MYTTKEAGNAVTLIIPKEEYKNLLWQLPLEERKRYRKKAVIVVQEESSIYNNSEVENANK